MHLLGNLHGMNLQKFLQSLPAPDRDAFALTIGTTPGYVRLLRLGHKRVGPAMAKKIFAATDGQVGLHELRPDIWAPSASGRSAELSLLRG
jgi:DNA-binding transcriptional regulator YdaS (Cro superfamily)